MDLLRALREAKVFEEVRLLPDVSFSPDLFVEYSFANRSLHRGDWGKWFASGLLWGGSVGLLPWVWPDPESVTVGFMRATDNHQSACEAARAQPESLLLIRVERQTKYRARFWLLGLPLMLTAHWDFFDPIEFRPAVAQVMSRSPELLRLAGR